MELLDRYLHSVRFWLPKAQQKDIIAELSDDIHSQIEDKESALGRPINEDELVALLQQTGHPMRVAARYQPQQSLIGPALFPIYKFVLKLVTLFYLIPWVVVWIATVAFVPSHRAGNPVMTVLEGSASLLTTAFVNIGIVTLAFALVERFQSKIPGLTKWDPRKLPAVPKPKDKNRVPRVESVFELVFNFLFLLGWLAVPQLARQIFASAGNTLAPAPALHVWYWPVLVPVVISMAQQLTNLFRPQWTWLRPAARMLSTAIILWIVESLVKIYPLFIVVAKGGKDAARLANLEFFVNQSSWWSLYVFAVSLCIALVVYTFQCVQLIRRRMEGPRNGAAIAASQLL
jgi:hypothetical protein